MLELNERLIIARSVKFSNSEMNNLTHDCGNHELQVTGLNDDKVKVLILDVTLSRPMEHNVSLFWDRQTDGWVIIWTTF